MDHMVVFGVQAGERRVCKDNASLDAEMAEAAADAVYRVLQVILALGAPHLAIQGGLQVFAEGELTGPYAQAADRPVQGTAAAEPVGGLKQPSGIAQGSVQLFLAFERKQIVVADAHLYGGTLQILLPQAFCHRFAENVESEL